MTDTPFSPTLPAIRKAAGRKLSRLLWFDRLRPDDNPRVAVGHDPTLGEGAWITVQMFVSRKEIEDAEGRVCIGRALPDGVEHNGMPT